MSYDIDLVTRAPGQDWDEALEATVDAPEPTAEERAALVAVLDRIEARLAGVLGPWETSVADEGTVIGELTDLETGVQVGLYATSASVTYPYWEQEDPAAFHAAVAEVVKVVAEETGHTAYDPQTGEEWDGTFEDERGIEVVRQLHSGELDGEPERADDAVTRMQRAAGVAETRRSGNNSTLLLVIGTVIAVGAAVLIVVGEAGFFTWLALGIGIMDVVVGLRRRRA